MNTEIYKLRENCVTGTSEAREKARSVVHEQYSCCDTPVFRAGSHVSTAIEICISNANATGNVQWLKFNSDEGIPIFPGDDNEKEIYDVWENFCTLRHNEWKVSPEGIEFENEQKLQHIKNIESARKAENEFLNININRMSDIIQWISDHVENIQSLSVDFDGLTIVNRLKTAGYKKDENTNNDFIQSDRNNFGRYIIGQLISTIEWMGIPYPTLAFSAKNWLEWPSMRRMYVRFVPGWGWQFKHNGKVYTSELYKKLPFAVMIAKDKESRQPVVSGKTLPPKRWTKLSTYLDRANNDVKHYNGLMKRKRK